MSRRLGVPGVLRRPSQGWSSLLLLLGMLWLLGISIVDARPLVPLTGARSLTGSFPALLVAGGLVGFLLARSRLGVVRAHLLGAITAALLLLLVGGTWLLDDGVVTLVEPSLSRETAAVWQRLAEDVRAYVAGETITPVLATYLVLGAICWATAQFAMSSVFRFGRGGPAVLTVGTVLFLNVGLGGLGSGLERIPMLPLLAAFSALAMLLLLRLQLEAQHTAWARRHISDAREVRRLFLRTGSLFVALTVTAATSLTTVATVEAQRIDLGDWQEPIEELGDQIAGLLGLVGVPPPDATATTRPGFTPILERWLPGEGTAFTAIVEGRLRGNYWWGWSDDQYDAVRGGWRSTAVRSRDVDRGDDTRAPEASAGRRHPVDVVLTIGSATSTSRQAFRLAEASGFEDRDVEVFADTQGGSVSDIRYRDDLEEGDQVTVHSLVRDYAGGTSLTADELRAAGDAYPPWTEKYLQGRGDARISGPGVRDLVARTERVARNAYDQAIYVQDELRAMDYDPNIEGLCAGRSIPECLLAEGRGFCVQYATTMTMVLRELGIPSRFVTGYLPGELDVASGTWTVEQAALHTWVEAWFPKIGWVRFDPTPARPDQEQQVPTRFPEDAGSEPGSGDLPDPTFDPTFEETPEPSPDPAALVPFEPQDDGSSTILIISFSSLAAILLAVVSALLLARLRRLPEGDVGLAYRGIVSLATRLGYGPHPAQTEYEYAGALSEAIPSVREELYVVTDARVETAYGKRRLDPARSGLLRQAYARIRTALLRLSLRPRR